MSFLLDTCVISELVHPRPEPAVLEWHVVTRNDDDLRASGVKIVNPWPTR